MTALVADEVQRTFSAGGRQFAGLRRANTHEASGQDLSDLVNSVLRLLNWKCRARHRGKLNDPPTKSSTSQWLTYSGVNGRGPASANELESCE
jgi:hypothetical protein